MASLQELRERLEKGFYIHNLDDMVRMCRSLALDTDSPAPFFVMQHIFFKIARYWEDKPLPVEEARLVQSEMVKPLEDLISAIEANASSEQTLNLLNRVVSSYLFLFP